MSVVDCKEMINGSQCHRDHSRLVCNSGLAYCLAARAASKTGMADIDVMQATLSYCQDITVNRNSDSRVIWDNG